MNRPPPVLLLLLALLALALVAQVVPLYTDWLWFGEVGYTSVFVKTLSLPWPSACSSSSTPT